MIRFVFFAMVCGILSAGCRQSLPAPGLSPAYNCTTCVREPEAISTYDKSSRGIYKGVLEGSSGTIKIDVMNYGDSIRAYLRIDGITDTLAPVVSWASGAPYSAAFAGKFFGQPDTIVFSVAADGSNPAISAMNIPGHPAITAVVLKETSGSLLECFEGSITDTIARQGGNFNLVLATGQKEWQALEKFGSDAVFPVSGVLNNKVLSSSTNGTVDSATLSGDQVINGKWKAAASGSGTWFANRTL